MRMRTFRCALALVGISLLGGCSGVSYQCSGACTAPDGGSVHLSVELSATNPADAEGTCLQQMGLSLGIYCSPQIASCAWR